MRASLKDDHWVEIGIHKEVNILQQKQSYRDVLESGTSSGLKTESYQKDSITGCVTLAQWKVYLDSCATYHTSFVESILTKARQVNSLGAIGFWRTFVFRSKISYFRSSTEE